MSPSFPIKVDVQLGHFRFQVISTRAPESVERLPLCMSLCLLSLSFLLSPSPFPTSYYSLPHSAHWHLHISGLTLPTYIFLETLPSGPSGWRNRCEETLRKRSSARDEGSAGPIRALQRAVAYEQVSPSPWALHLSRMFARF